MAKKREGHAGSPSDTDKEHELADKLRAMKKRYMRAVKENARLKKELAKYEDRLDDEKVSQEIAEATYVLEKEVCPECHEGTLEEFTFGTKILKICNRCRCRATS